MQLRNNKCKMINLLNKFQAKDFLQYLSFSQFPMFYESPLKFPQEALTYSSLPNIHPESFDCIVRSEATNKGSLYVSNLEGAQNPDVFKKLKVTSVLTCAEGYRLDHFQQLIPNYKYFPLPENPIFSLLEYFHESADFLIKALSKSNCLVHCLTGQNKSIAVVVAYLIKNYSMGLDDALAYVKRKRKLVNLNQTYTQALKQFALSIKNHKTNTNQTQNYTLTYKTQNSRLDNQFNNYSGQQKSVKSSLSQAHTSKKSQNNQSKAEPFKNTAITFNKKQKLQTHASKILSNHHSRYQTRSPQIHSNPNSKDLSTHTHIQNHIEKSKTQASKIPTQKKSRYASFSLDHKEAMHFDQIFSSAHQNYVGVKRQHKNSSMSFKKQKGNSINFSSNQQNSQFLEPQRNIDLLKVSNELSKSRASQSRQNESKNNKLRTQRSDMKSQKNSIIGGKSSRMNTKKSQIDQNNCSRLRILNPQNEEAKCYRLQGDKKSSLRMKSRQSVPSLNASQIEYENNQLRTESDQLEISKILSPQFKLGESRRDYFSAVNEELNSNVKEICSSFDSEISNCRIRYQNRLRQLLEPGKSKKSTECGSPANLIY